MQNGTSAFRRKKISYEEVVITPENIDVYSAQGIRHTPLLVLDNDTNKLIGKAMFDYIKNLEAAK